MSQQRQAENIHDPQVMSAPATSSYDIDGMALKRVSETSEMSETLRLETWR